MDKGVLKVNCVAMQSLYTYHGIINMLFGKTIYITAVQIDSCVYNIMHVHRRM